MRKGALLVKHSDTLLYDGVHNTTVHKEKFAFLIPELDHTEGHVPQQLNPFQTP